jgi:hypothetical protein
MAWGERPKPCLSSDTLPTPQNSLNAHPTALNPHKSPMCHTPNCIYDSSPTWSSHQISPIHNQKQKLSYDTSWKHISRTTLTPIPDPPCLHRHHVQDMKLHLLCIYSPRPVPCSHQPRAEADLGPVQCHFFSRSYTNFFQGPIRLSGPAASRRSRDAEPLWYNTPPT